MDIFGDGVTASGTSTAGNIITSGSGSTLTISPTQAQFMTNYTSVAFGASPYTALVTDHYISCVSSGGAITILNFPMLLPQIDYLLLKIKVEMPQ